ncbi:MAG: S-formylglutathione hydrolase [Alphaproteobacteria bacterium]|nr:S-formylglutathione hydrolase [Alphaproteobacteria bacterium]
MPQLTREEAHRCFGGTQEVFSYASEATGSRMRFAVYTPPQPGPRPALWFLSGLTCTEQNVITKAGAQRACAEHGVVLICPDTSPRGTQTPGDTESWDLGEGASYYVDATAAPWAKHYRMETWITEELRAVVAAHFPVDPDRQGITGHSMGGHGALVLALRDPSRYRSLSALSPICALSRCPWGEKALPALLGDDPAAWARWDAAALIRAGARVPEILVDQGMADPFLEGQLKPELLEAACAAAGQPLTLRRHEGYDHGYYFVASVIGAHVAWHAERLG